MRKQLLKLKETLSTTRRYARVAAFVVSAIVILVALGLWIRFEYEVTNQVTHVTETMTPQGPLMEEAQPVKLSIPAINLETSFSEPLGLEPSGEIQVPEQYDSVAYYKNGPTPGELGPAVVLGHVDSLEGPAVFFSLGQLKKGDEIKIERADGSVAVFEVTSLERHEQSGFPTRKVYGDIDHAGLRLITCTGIYDRDVLRYTHNLIVFGKLKTIEREGE